MGKYIYIFYLLLFINHTIPSLAKDVIIQGTVRNINTYQRIPGVNIFVKNTNVGTISNSSGTFTIDLQNPDPNMIFIFQHISYDICEIKLDSLQSLKTIYLQPRVIPLQNVRVEAQREKSRNILIDLPQSISIIRADKFENQGFLDAGDYLKTDYSIQIDEDFSGKKSIGMRGSNPDDVLILYNGIKMNNPFDNTFDLALIDLQDVERLEIIRGSNTSAYGSGGTAGVINIVPKIERDHNIRFQQKFGSYDTGMWGLHLYGNLSNVHSAYSYRKGARKRQFLSSSQDGNSLINKSTHHTANLNYKLKNSSLGGMFMRSNLFYENQRYLEDVENLNQLFSINYSGNVYKLNNINLFVSRQDLEDQYNRSATYFSTRQSARINIFLTRNIKNKSYYFTIDKKWAFKRFEIFIAYQLEDSKLDFRNEFYDNRSEDIAQYVENMNRTHHGFLAIGKLFSSADLLSNKSMNMDISVRNDQLSEEKINNNITETKNWNITTVKFSSNYRGSKDNVIYHGFMNYGKNVKFPTMLQKVSASSRDVLSEEDMYIEPEISKGYDIGFEITGHTPRHVPSNIYGWQIEGYLFRTDYGNKLRASYTPGFPLAFYDNVITAEISGFETKSNLYFFNKKLTAGLGYSHYSISNKSAFPFKYDNKVTLNLNFDHKGYHIEIYLFNESEQIGWIRDFTGRFEEVNLPGHTNLDLHFKKNLEINKIKIFANLSIFNLLNEDVELSGLAFRDRRIYLTFGAEL